MTNELVTPMTRRPLSITLLAWVFIVVGSIGLASGLLSLGRVASSGGIDAMTRDYLIDTGWHLLSGLVATIGGAGLLHGFRWARWVCLSWMAFHVVLSFLHSPFEVSIHSIMLLAMLYLLLRPGAMDYTRRTHHPNTHA